MEHEDIDTEKVTFIWNTSVSLLVDLSLIMISVYFSATVCKLESRT